MAKKTTELLHSAYFQYLDTFKYSNTIRDFSHYVQNIKKNAFFKKLLDAMPCAVAITDYQTQSYLYANETIEEIMGYSVKELTEKGIPLFVSGVHPDDREIISNHSFPQL